MAREFPLLLQGEGANQAEALTPHRQSARRASPTAPRNCSFRREILLQLPTALLIGLCAAAQADPPEPPPLAGSSTVEPAAAEPTPAEPTSAEQTPDPAPPVVGTQPTPAEPAREIEFKEALLLPRVGDYTRGALHRDPVEAALAEGGWRTPQAGDAVEDAYGNQQTWRAVTIDPQQGLLDPSAPGGYALVTLESPTERVVLLAATRHAAVCVNGAWRTGDPYGAGTLRLPIKLRAGANELLFHLAGPGFRGRLIDPSSEHVLLAEDATLPDFIEGLAEPLWGAIPIANCGAEPLEGAEIVCESPAGVGVAKVPRIEAQSVLKVPMVLRPDSWRFEPTSVRVVLRQAGAAGAPPRELAEATLQVQHAQAGGPQVRTFQSAIDGAVQRYAVAPATAPPAEASAVGIVLALHGPGESCDQLLKHYEPKRWAHVVCPENRRPHGFDWEDWGARDALEALDAAQKALGGDPNRVCLTGHSMGGHGAWHLAATYPDRFAATAPSGGWISFKAYGGSLGLPEQTPIESMLERAASPSETLRLVRNLAPLRVFVLHGEQDQTTPVAQSRYMRSRLAEFHGDFTYREQAGAGAWWGPASCDNPELMSMLESARRPATPSVDAVDFITLDPGRSSTMHWLSIERQIRQLEPTRVSLRRLRDERLFVGTTENASALSIGVAGLPPAGPIGVRLDGGQQVVARWPGEGGRIWLRRTSSGAWRLADSPRSVEKNPSRCGGFKAAFDRNALLVYGTVGSPEEDQWARDKAIFDSETFWWRGNGALEVIPDTSYSADLARGRNLVLYGSRDSNSVWPRVLSSRQLDVRRGSVRLGLRAEQGEGLGVLAVYPRAGTSNNLVGVVGGAGLSGMRSTGRLRYFFAGAGFPDVLMLGPETLQRGAPGVRAAGYFGPAWTTEPGEIVWRDEAL